MTVHCLFFRNVLDVWPFYAAIVLDKSPVLRWITLGYDSLFSLYQTSCCMFVMFTYAENYFFVLFSTNNTILTVKPPFKYPMHHQNLLTCDSIGHPIILGFCWKIQSSMCNWQRNSNVVINQASMCTECTKQIRPIWGTILHAWYTHYPLYIMSSKYVIYMGCVGW